MKHTILTILALVLLVACAPVRAQKPSAKPLAPAPEPTEIVIPKIDAQELSIALADITIAEKEVKILELQAAQLRRQLADARDTLSNAKATYQSTAKTKFVAAGIPADDLDNWSGTQDSAGRLVMRRAEKSTK